MRNTLKSINAICPASKLENEKRHSDLVGSADIMRLYLQISLGAQSLTEWLGYLRRTLFVRVPTTPITPTSPRTHVPHTSGPHMSRNAAATSLPSRAATERCGPNHPRLSFASIVR